jgi:hypothetical protein
MVDKLASILIPSRNRFDSLLEAVGSIVSNTKFLEKIEIIIRFDKDDENSLSRLDELPTDKVDINIMVGEKYGYIELYKYVNEMCEKTKGEFIVWFNDDCVIKTKEWDAIIAEYTGKIVCFYPDHKGTGSGNIFPIISRKIYEITGHFALSQQVDTWQQVVGKRAGIVVRRNDLIFIHNREQNYVSDKNRKKVLRKTRQVWEQTNKIRVKDANKVKQYIDQNKKK